VHEERDAPNQILIGAMDPWFCVLPVWLEVFIESGRGALTPYVFGFSDDYTVPRRSKANPSQPFSQMGIQSARVPNPAGSSW
jgi:hypothetical protein